MLTFKGRQKAGCFSAILQFCLAECTVDKLVIASLFLEPKVTPHFTLQVSQRDKLCFFKVVNIAYIRVVPMECNYAWVISD